MLENNSIILCLSRFMKNILLRMIAACILIVSIFFLTTCDLINPASQDYGSQDYIPLAVGNYWEYTNVYTLYGRTPNGPYTSSQITYSTSTIIATERKSDTVELFTAANMYRSQDWRGAWESTYDTSKIERTPHRIGNLSPRTGQDSILRIVIYPGPGYVKYKKGVGCIESRTSGLFHITAGNQGDYTSITTLTKYSVK